MHNKTITMKSFNKVFKGGGSNVRVLLLEIYRCIALSFTTTAIGRAEQPHI